MKNTQYSWTVENAIHIINDKTSVNDTILDILQDNNEKEVNCPCEHRKWTSGRIFFSEILANYLRETSTFEISYISIITNLVKKFLSAN